MLSNRSKFVSVLIAMMLVLSLTIPVFAQDEIEPVDEPEVVETSSKFSDHPIVKLLAEFFASFFNPPVEDEPALDEGDGTGEVGDPGVPPPDEGDLDGDAEDEGEDGGEGGEPEEQQIVPEEKIASMHEDDKLGFGVIVKLIGIVECAEGGVILDILVAEFKDGIGLGELFEMYCKPEHLGVGQIRKNLNPEEEPQPGVGGVDLTGEELGLMGKEKTNKGKAKGKDK